MMRRVHIPGLAALCLALSTDTATAHSVGSPHSAFAWGWTALTFALLTVSAWAYRWGLRRLWRRAGTGAGVRRWQAAVFAVGWLWTAVALLSPLDQWGEELFSVHMLQHEILMLIAAPLIILGRPAVVFLWAFSVEARRGLGRFFAHPWWLAVWRPWTSPLGAWTTYAVVLWAWHVPFLFEAATVHDGIHTLQHVSFFGAALLFWWVFLDATHGRRRNGMAVLANFTTAIHSSLLGALFTFAPAAFYAPYLETTAYWGLTALEDQQLGGLIMWIPGGLVHLAAGLVAAARWIGPETGTDRLPERTGSGR
ncbi:cytochrome c oxidase assembly protein [Rhodoligotrophos defluvii]|uniref:cytochrome c oxidase assembly protein n=1 Tax=Rhodoligotrophos defluvii TaxID=2561934 RepID=UPI00148565CE|nr:cytochrome c oxidase assembly protein [Rhodoligotrophos defluvii]